jgi:hypothetical protein
VLLAVAGLLDAINVVGNRAVSLTCLFHTSFFWCSSPDIKTQLVGKYQVVLGPGGGCNGGPPNSRPKQPAFIDNNNGSLIATNECRDRSPVDVLDSRHGTWWSQPIDFIVDGRNITITEHRNGGNSWEKIK